MIDRSPSRRRDRDRDRLWVSMIVFMLTTAAATQARATTAVPPPAAASAADSAAVQAAEAKTADEQEQTPADVQEPGRDPQTGLIPEPSPVLMPAPAAGPAPATSGAADERAASGVPDAAAGADLELAPQVTPVATFTFKPTVETSRGRLILGELATCAGLSQVCDEAYAVDLGASPEPGRTALLQLDKLRTLLAREWPETALRFDAPKLVKVVALASALDEASVVSELKNAVEEHLPGDGPFTVTVDKATFVSTVRLRPGEFTIEFPELSAEHLQSPEWVRRNLAGSQRLPALCVFDGDAGAPVAFTVMAQLSLKEKLPVLTRAMAKGEVIQDDDLTLQPVELSRSSFHLVTDAKDLIGRRLKRPAPAFAPLQPNQVEVPKVIKRGQLVRLVMHASGLDVSSQVEALDNAGFGQTIEAVYPTTKKKLRVRVVDATTVEYAL